MKRRSHASKAHVRSKRRTPKHLRFHMVFIYSTMCIFGLTILLAIAHTVLQPIAAKNTAYYSSRVTVLGAQQERQSFFTTFLNLILPSK